MHGKALKKPVPIEWYLWDGTYETANAIILWQDPDGSHLDDPFFRIMHDWLAVGTSYDAQVYDFLHSRWIPLRTGDYVMKGVRGECYPCEKTVFEDTYDITERNEG